MSCFTADDDVVASVQRLCATKPFFRGGQAHGSLRKDAVGDALRAFLQQCVDSIAADASDWSEAVSLDARSRSVRKFVVQVSKAAPIFGAGPYWTKRFIEIVLLASIAGVREFRASPADIDMVADIWPIASGTKAALRHIFPTLRRDQDLRQGLRVLQRSLGGGTIVSPSPTRHCFKNGQKMVPGLFWRGALKTFKFV